MFAKLAMHLEKPLLFIFKEVHIYNQDTFTIFFFEDNRSFLNETLLRALPSTESKTPFQHL